MSDNTVTTSEVSKISSIFMSAIAIFIIIVFFNTCIGKVPIDKVGIRSMQLGGGIEKRDLKAGYYIVLPGIHKLRLLDATVQSIYLGGRDYPPVSLKLADQYTTSFSITVLFRIKKDKAHKVLAEIGTEYDYRRIVKDTAMKVFADILGGLNTEEFYDSEKRVEQAGKALSTMKVALDKSHLEILNVLIRNIKFDPRFEATLLQKQLLDQGQFLNQSLTKKEKALGKTQQIHKETYAKVLKINEEREQAIKTRIAETDRAIEGIVASAKRTAKTMIAKAESYKRTKIAEGKLEIAKAQAKGAKAINNAYSGFGGDLFITKQMIENIEFGDIVLNTNKINPFDLTELLKMFGAKSEK